VSVIVQLPAELGVESPRRFALGGMGELFTADKIFPHGGRTRLVVKHMLPQYLDTEELVSRFRDEARLGLTLRHSNIVRVYEYWEIDNHHYMVMEEIDGFDLAEIIICCQKQKRQIPAPVAAYFMLGIASALAYMADATTPDGRNLGLVHRDISPSNVLVSQQGVIKLIDFGVAKAAERETQTATGVFVGKYAFMSPEQIRGDDVNIRSDLFALGAVGYELLTTQRAFKGVSEFETLNLVLSTEPDPLAEQRPDLHPLLVKIVERCMAKDAGARYHHPLQLVQDLHRYFHAASEQPPPLVAIEFLHELGLMGKAATENPETHEADTEPQIARQTVVLNPPPLDSVEQPRAPGPPSATTEQIPTPRDPSGPTLTGRPPTSPRFSVDPEDDLPVRSRRRWLAWVVTIGAAGTLLLVLFVGLAGTWGAQLWRQATEPSSASFIDDGAVGTDPGAAPTAAADPAEAPAADPADAAAGVSPADQPAPDPEPADAAPPPPPVIARTGTIHVMSIPWANISIDGVDLGRAPVPNYTLPQGTHTIKAVREDLNWSEERRVKIKADETLKETFNPARAEAAAP